MTDEDLQLVGRWLADKSDNTRRDYSIDVGILSEWVAERYNGYVPLRHISSHDLESYRAWLEDPAGGVARATARRRIAAVKSLFRFGHAIGAFDRDAGASIGLVNPESVPRPDLRMGPENVRSVIKACDRFSHALLIRTLYLTGLRAPELAGLMRRDLLLAPSGGRSSLLVGDRRVWIPETLAVDIDGYNSVSKKSHLIFPGERQISRIVREAGERAGYPNLTAAQLRRAHRRQALTAGCPVGIVLRSLGESAPATSTGEDLEAQGAARDYSSALFLAKYDVPAAPLFAGREQSIRATVTAD